MAAQLAPVYVNDTRVTLQGDPNPQVSKIVTCWGKSPEAIKEIYWLAVEARAAGQVRIPIHIFPARLDGEGVSWLRAQFGADSRRMTFWDELRPAYEFFELQREVPDITVDGAGRYRLRS